MKKKKKKGRPICFVAARIDNKLPTSRWKQKSKSRCCWKTWVPTACQRVEVTLPKVRSNPKEKSRCSRNGTRLAACPESSSNLPALSAEPSARCTWPPAGVSPGEQERARTRRPAETRAPSLGLRSAARRKKSK